MINSFLKLIRKEQRTKLYLLFAAMFIGMMFEIGGISLLLPTLGIIMNPEFIEDNKDFLGLFYDHIKNFNHNEIVIYVICLIVFYNLIKTVYLIFLSYIQNILLTKLKRGLQGLYNGYIRKIII